MKQNTKERYFYRSVMGGRVDELACRHADGSYNLLPFSIMLKSGSVRNSGNGAGSYRDIENYISWLNSYGQQQELYIEELTDQLADLKQAIADKKADHAQAVTYENQTKQWLNDHASQANTPEYQLKSALWTTQVATSTRLLREAEAAQGAYDTKFELLGKVRQNLVDRENWMEKLSEMRDEAKEVYDAAQRAATTPTGGRKTTGQVWKPKGGQSSGSGDSESNKTGSDTILGMPKTTGLIVLIGGGVVIAGGIGYLAYKFLIK